MDINYLEYPRTLLEQITEYLKSWELKDIRVKEEEDLVDDYGNEYFFLIFAYLDWDVLGFDTMDDVERFVEGLASHINKVILTSGGDYGETCETPITLNSSVIFPITFLK